MHDFLCFHLKRKVELQVSETYFIETILAIPQRLDRKKATPGGKNSLISVTRQ